MARKRYKPEEIVAKLRQVDVLVSQGQNMMGFTPFAIACLHIASTDSDQAFSLRQAGGQPHVSQCR